MRQAKLAKIFGMCIIQFMDKKEIIQKAGGVRAVAEALKVTTQAVYDWKKIPPKHVMKVAKMAGVDPEIVNPEMFA